MKSMSQVGNSFSAQALGLGEQLKQQELEQINERKKKGLRASNPSGFGMSANTLLGLANSPSTGY